MKQITTRAEQKENRAVSPVIGVILMVAITVILAAVIGAFVLEIGDQQETAPSTSFDTEEEVRFVDTYPSNGADTKYNLSQVSITHAGGEVLDISQTEIKVEGNESVWGPPSDTFEYQSWAGDTDRNPIAVPQPNWCKTQGTNEEVAFSSGQTWRVLFSGPNFDGWNNGPYNPLGDARAKNREGCGYENFVFYTRKDTEEPRVYAASSGSYTGIAQGWKPLQQGDDVTVVWTAASGGKTQTLQKYTVQSGGDF